MKDWGDSRPMQCTALVRELASFLSWALRIHFPSRESCVWVFFALHGLFSRDCERRANVQTLTPGAAPAQQRRVTPPRIEAMQGTLARTCVYDPHNRRD